MLCTAIAFKYMISTNRKKTTGFAFYSLRCTLLEGGILAYYSAGIRQSTKVIQSCITLLHLRHDSEPTEVDRLPFTSVGFRLGSSCTLLKMHFTGCRIKYNTYCIIWKIACNLLNLSASEYIGAAFKLIHAILTLTFSLF